MLLSVLVVGACHRFDPVAEVPHREAPDTQSAIELILAENPPPRVFAIGEYHQTRATAGATSSMQRFTREIIGLLEPRARHLVVESWVDDACDSRFGHQVAATIDRPATTQMELMRLVRTSQRAHLDTHDLPMTCIEQHALFDPRHGVDFLLLLEVITQKLHDAARTWAEADPAHAVIVYGGALHNDLYPRWALDELSYAEPLARELGPGSVLEIDLVVPEIVAPMRMVRDEPWFPLLGRASPSRAIVWRRGPGSYVVILPAQSEAVARVALPDEVM
ncbi:MAG: hypothetical protein ACM31C_06885 [Acidobacteriota bacterium]